MGFQGHGLAVIVGIRLKGGSHIGQQGGLGGSIQGGYRSRKGKAARLGGIVARARGTQ